MTKFGKWMTESMQSRGRQQCLVSSCENIITLAEFYPLIYTSKSRRVELSPPVMPWLINLTRLIGSV